MITPTTQQVTKYLPAVFALALAPACATPQATTASSPPLASQETAPVNEDKKLLEFFEEVFQRTVDRNPTIQTYLGVKKDYDKWSDISDKRAQEDHALNLQDLKRLQSFDLTKLSPANQISYRLFEQATTTAIEQFEWRFHSYPVNQMYGTHTQVPTLLIGFHNISSLADAEAYISRLQGIKPLFKNLEANLITRAKKGIIAPKFVFPLVIESCLNLLSGQPFDNEAEADSTLLSDLKAKLAKLDSITPEDKRRLISEAQLALSNFMKPAYISLIATLKSLEKQATTDDGAWKFPNGTEYYSKALQWTTTTNLSAEEIHNLGLKEVARIHAEMRTIMEKVNFEGSLQDFFQFMRTDKQFYYPNTDEGRKQYLDKATAIIDAMKARLPELFATFPTADLVVKRVEPFRERAAGKAFYNRPALDGSRPGYYYANLYDMSDMPTYQMEALAFHEGIPGHHMQLAIAQEITGLPKFRKFGRYTAYSEGWGLYSEFIPKEMGFYEDPYSDFGRLAMEIWRACRLVVDTGIHHKKWTREQAIQYLAENTPNPKGDIAKAIERYIVMPSQATAYKIGMLKLLELRQKAKDALGEKFDIRSFHDVVLINGPVPLTLLEELVESWINQAAS